MAMNTPERQLEESLVAKLRDLKYEYRPDIRDRATLEANFREKFEALNRVTLASLLLLLDELEPLKVFDGIINGARRQDRVELASGGGGFVLVEDRYDRFALGNRLVKLELVLTFRLVVVDMEAQDIAVLDRVGDGVLV